MTISLETLAGHLSKPRLYAGRYYAALCPWHGDSKPSMLVYPDGFRCTACGKTGSLAMLAKKLKAKPMNPLSSTRSAYIPWTEITADLTAFCLDAHEAVIRHPNLAAYLIGRGVADRIKQYQLGWYNGWITIPVKSNDQIVGVGFRATPDLHSENRYTVPPGQRITYSPTPDRIKTADKIFVPFGWFDGIAIDRLGFAVKAWTLGKQPPPDLFENDRCHIFAVPDFGEVAEAAKFVSKLGWRGHVLELDYHSGYKDPADFMKGGDLDDLKRQLKAKSRV